MFSGIVEEIGRVHGLEASGPLARLDIAARLVSPALVPGSSIAVSGCCLTVVASGPDRFACELTPETLRRTGFDQRLRPGTPVNLERPLRADGRFEGHIVQGHVDGVGHITDLRRQDEAAELVVEAPVDLARYLVEKSSVAVDGISLTVATLAAGVFTVAVIPYTLGHTNLAEARPGDRVNLEVDILAKYVERLLRKR